MDTAQTKTSNAPLVLKRLSSLRCAEMEAAPADAEDVVRAGSSNGRRSRMGHRRRIGSQSSFTGSIVDDDEIVERRAGATSRLAFHHEVEDERVERTVRRVSRLGNLKQCARESSSELSSGEEKPEEESRS